MYLIQLLLPLYDNSGERFDSRLYTAVGGELVERFGGITTYNRAPARGLWQDSQEVVVRDDLIIYEVMSEALDRRWWRAYRHKLQARFRQEALVIRAQRIALL